MGQSPPRLRLLNCTQALRNISLEPKPLRWCIKDENQRGHLSDPDLIARARRRDEAAWEALAREHQEAVFRLAYLILGDPADADDVAQEAFIRAYGALDRFDTSRAVRPWLFLCPRLVVRPWRVEHTGGPGAAGMDGLRSISAGRV